MREVKKLHKHLAGPGPVMKTSAKMYGAREEKAMLVLQDKHAAPLKECCKFRMFTLQLGFFLVVHYCALVLSLAVSLLSEQLGRQTKPSEILASDTWQSCRPQASCRYMATRIRAPDSGA